jgi:adenosylmethionine-8-amino-7-oxononanoate aminotransferase
MAVCDPVNGMHDFFRGVLADHLFAERPECRYHEPFEERHIAGLSGLLEEHGDEIAAVILEPIVQGAGGMWFYAPGYLRRLRSLCDEHDVPLILDEIATGFGRTGEFFGADHAEIAPDLMCVGKALTGGTMTLAATLANDRIADVIASTEPGALMHGPTFMGNPLACSAANASLDLLEKQPLAARIAGIAHELEEGLAPCRAMGGVEDVRVLGAIGVVELERAVDMATIQPAFVERGVWIRPFGRLVYTMPPFVTEPRDLEIITSAICDVLSEHACA